MVNGGANAVEVAGGNACSMASYGDGRCRHAHINSMGYRALFSIYAAHIRAAPVQNGIYMRLFLA